MKKRNYKKNEIKKKAAREKLTKRGKDQAILVIRKGGEKVAPLLSTTALSLY